MPYIGQANIKRIVGIVECGVPMVRISLDKDCSKSFSFSSLAVFLKVGIHDPVEVVLAGR